MLTQCYPSSGHCSFCKSKTINHCHLLGPFCKKPFPVNPPCSISLSLDPASDTEEWRLTPVGMGAAKISQQVCESLLLPLYFSRVCQDCSFFSEIGQEEVVARSREELGRTRTTVIRELGRALEAPDVWLQQAYRKVFQLGPGFLQGGKTKVRV